MNHEGSCPECEAVVKIDTATGKVRPHIGCAFVGVAKPDVCSICEQNPCTDRCPRRVAGVRRPFGDDL